MSAPHPGEIAAAAAAARQGKAKRPRASRPQVTPVTSPRGGDEKEQTRE